ncbi:MAG TPA: hypothetical protein VH207_16000 [Chthoniobacterales bacterium]|jgi:hypothetical protein|nr:hypothetical protein [Chthoniobacterales bacterium]
MFRLLLGFPLLVLVTELDKAAGEPSPSPRSSRPLAPFKERLAAARSVKVETKILGLEPDATLEEAHEKLDPLANRSQPAIEAKEGAEHEEDQRKVLWELAKSDFKSVLVKTDEKERIIYIAGFLRPGKEVPFDKIGETKNAPILNNRMVAWDVVRPDQPLIRVVARGEKRKASLITIFVVKRPPQPN